MRTLAIILALALTSCASFDGAGGESRVFAKLRPVVGGRTVVGVEFPPLFFPLGFGAGVWLVRPALDPTPSK